MTIERISFQDGHPFVLERYNSEVQTIINGPFERTVLSAGDYNLTPGRSVSTEFGITVFSSGRGEFRATRSIPGEEPQKISHSLPRDTEMEVIANPMKDSRPGIFEVVLFTFGRSPESTHRRGFPPRA